MKPCPEDVPIEEWFELQDGKLEPLRAQELRVHRASCAVCAERWTALDGMRSLVQRELARTPVAGPEAWRTEDFDLAAVRRRAWRRASRPRLLRLLAVPMAAAALVLLVLRLNPPAPAGALASVDALAAADVQQRTSRALRARTEFFDEPVRGAPEVSFLLPVPSESYPDLEAAWSASSDGDRLLFVSEDDLRRRLRARGWEGEDLDGDGGWDFSSAEGRSLRLLRLTDPLPVEGLLSEVRAELESEWNAWSAASDLAPRPSGEVAVFLRITLARSRNVCVVAIPPDAPAFLAWPPEGTADTRLGTGTSLLPPLDPMATLPTGETLPLRALLAGSTPQGRVYMEHAGAILRFVEGRIEQSAVRVTVSPEPLSFQAGTALLLVLSEGESPRSSLLEALRQTAASEGPVNQERRVRDWALRIQAAAPGTEVTRIAFPSH